MPSAVPSSSSSSSSSDGGGKCISCLICCLGETCPKEGMCSFELVRTRSSEEDSDSSYSSWLLVLRWAASWEMRDAPAGPCRRPRRKLDDCTRNPAVTISLSMEDKDEDDGWDDISTHDSVGTRVSNEPSEEGLPESKECIPSLRKRWVASDERAMVSHVRGARWLDRVPSS